MAESVSRILRGVWNRTFNSVGFGIAIMVLMAGYVAAGSAFASLIRWAELSEPDFFNAWPMWVLAVLLVLNLCTVTLDRIPFTPPRYGVWMVHVGIVVLVFGMVYYFVHKTEGLTLIREGETVDWYHDSHERALYVKIGARKAEPIPLRGLPRYGSYAAQHGNDGRLARWGLHGIEPTLRDYDEDLRAAREKPVHEVAGAPGDEPLRVDVVAYYPYAVLGATYHRDPDSPRVGLHLTLRDPETGQERTQWVIGGEPGEDEEQIATVRLRHVHRDDELTGESLLAAARHAHEFNWSVRGESGTVHLEPGDTADLGDTGYRVEVAEFLPSFPLFGDGHPVDAVELMVYPPADAPHPHAFRRYVLDGLPTQTDFLPDRTDAGPKGQRQEEPVDPDLVVNYALSDGLRLMPRGESERNTFLTRGDDQGIWRVVTAPTARAELFRVDGPLVEMAVDGQLRDPRTGQQRPHRLELDVRRVDGVGRQEWVQEVPAERRERDAERAGTSQVIALRVSRGDWSRLIHVPFLQWPHQQPWTLGEVHVPGFSEIVRFQLGNTARPMPAEVTLEKFDFVPYAGDFTGTSAMRDFRSHIEVRKLDNGEVFQGVARLNSPVFMRHRYPGPLGSVFPSESWLFYQNSWDPEAQSFTVLGVGNRPGIRTMIAGCVLITVGLLWAFYVKPVLLRRAGEKAAREADRTPDSNSTAMSITTSRPLAVVVGLLMLTAPAGASESPQAGGHAHAHGHHSTPPESSASAEQRTRAFAERLDLRPLQTVTVQHDSTLKTLDTLSRQALSAITGRSTLDGLDPVFSLLDMTYRPGLYAGRDVIRLKNVPLRQDLADMLFEASEDREAFMRHGHASVLFMNHGQVRQALERIEQRAVFKANAVREVQGATMTLEAMLHGGLFPPLRVVPPPGDGHTTWLVPDELIGNSQAVAEALRSVGMNPPDPADGVPEGSVDEPLLAALSLREAWQREDASAVNAAAARLASALQAVNPDAYPSASKRKFEVVYNRLAKLTVPGAFLYFGAFSLFLVGAYAATPGLRIWALRLMILAFLVHTASIGIRWWLVEKSTGDLFHSIPIKNQFESVLFSAWFGALVGLVFEMRRKAGTGGLFGAAAAFVGWLSLIALFAAPYVFGRDIGGELRHAPGILMSYWLYIHVTTVVAAYALIGMSFLLAVWWLVGYYTGRGTRPSEVSAALASGGFGQTLARTLFLPVRTTPVTGAFDNPAGTTPAVVRQRSLLERLDAANLVVLQLAFWVLGAGVIFGAIWADVSWGRPWGWDPKETFALVTWMVYLIVIHVRLITPHKAWWTAVLAVVGFVVMLFNWIGVNFYLVGLHSYA